MMQRKKILFILGVLIILMVFATVGYAVLSGMSGNKIGDLDRLNGVSDESSNSNISADGVVMREIRKDGDKYVENFEITINGRTGKFELEFTLTENGNYAEIKGVFNGEVFYSDTVEKNIDDFANTMFTEEKIREMFNENNFIYINGTDSKKYLLVLAKTSHYEVGYRDYLYFFNEKIESIGYGLDYSGCDNDKAMTIRSDAQRFVGESDSAATGYGDSFGVCRGTDCYTNVKVEGNRINYLKVNPETSELEERVYTINDSKLNYTVKNKIKIADIYGQTC